VITGFNHTSFTVLDMKSALRFWTEAMGFEARSVSPRRGDWQAKVTGVSGAELLVAHLYGHGTHLELIQYTAGSGACGCIDPNMPCAAHVCFDVTDIDDLWARLIAAGASPQGEIALVDTGPVKGLRAGYLRDPCGIIIELVENAPSGTC